MWCHHGMKDTCPLLLHFDRWQKLVHCYRCIIACFNNLLTSSAPWTAFRIPLMQNHRHLWLHWAHGHSDWHTDWQNLFFSDDYHLIWGTVMAKSMIDAILMNYTFPRVLSNVIVDEPSAFGVQLCIMDGLGCNKLWIILTVTHTSDTASSLVSLFAEYVTDWLCGTT